MKFGHFDPPECHDPVRIRRALWKVLREHKAEEARQVAPRMPGWPGPTFVAKPASISGRNDAARIASIILGEHLQHTVVEEQPVIRVFEEAIDGLFRKGFLRHHPEHPGIYVVTAKGEKVLDGGQDAEESTVGDGEVTARFNREFKDVPGASILVRYVDQAEKAVENQMDLAAAVMIGNAYELALLQLADALVLRWSDSAVGNLQDAHRKILSKHKEAAGDPGKAPKAAQLLDAVNAALNAAVAPGLPLAGVQKSWIQRNFMGNFSDVREARNDAGHPSGEVIQMDDLEEHVGRFVRDYKRVREIFDALAVA